MTSDWRVLISQLLSVRSQIYEIDQGRIWGYALPRVAASEEDIERAERRLGRRLEPGYRTFLTFANGWPHIAQDGLLFGTEELGQGEDWAIAVETLGVVAEHSSDPPTDAGPPTLIPIMLSRSTPSLVVLGQAERDSIVSWYYSGSLVDRWASFEGYFRALIVLATNDLDAVRTDPELRQLLID